MESGPAGYDADWWLSPEQAAALAAAGQHFAAGFLEGEGVSVAMRHAWGIAGWLEHAELPPYQGELLYPARRGIWEPTTPQVVWHHYVAIDLTPNADLAAKLAAAAGTEIERTAFERTRRFCDTYPRGGGYTHSIPNYGRVLAEGLDSYRDRIQAGLAATTDPDRQELYHALCVVVNAIDRYRQRVADYLGGLSFEEPERERNRRRLARAYRRLPSRPARGFFEAMVATIFLYAVDGSDNLGRFDQLMWPYYQADVAAGRLSRRRAVELVGALWQYVDDCTGWNVALGGTTPEGAEASNDLTLVCLEAGRRRRRPNLALRLRRDTPEPVWDAAIDTIATGCGLPALYCEENYLRAIDRAQLNLPDGEKRNFAFGGCTELMVHGCSNVGSLDDDFHALRILEQSLPCHLPHCPTFGDLLSAVEGDLRAGVATVTARVCRNQEVRDAWHPQLIRTLLIDDCLDRGKSYPAGGARWNWSIINVVGLSNVIDALAAVRQVVYEKAQVTPEQLLAALAADFAGFADVRRALAQAPKFGNDDPAVNELAHRLSETIYREFQRYAPWRGGRFLCGTLMFVTYGWFGEPVGATADGRGAGSPVADSAGPVQGRDRRGPTAMLHSVASLAQADAPGTLVVNVRLAREFFGTPEGRQRLKSLVRAYFDLGGMQLQVNVVDQAVLRDAIAHPERHGDLIVRVGGYSEYFNRLDDKLKLTILERTEHGREGVSG